VIKFTSCLRWWFSPGTPASSTTKTGRHDIAEILPSGIKNQNQSINQSKTLWIFPIQILYTLFFINQSETMAIWFGPIRSVNIIFGSINSLTPVKTTMVIIVW
jgi:hypothetical protein